MIILNDHVITQQLLDTRGAIHSDRFHTTMFELEKSTDMTPHLPYNEMLKEHRKVGQRQHVPFMQIYEGIGD